MRIFQGLSTFVSGFMLKLSQLPGLGFLQNYVATARSMKYRFGDHAEDYEIYLRIGEDIAGDVRGVAGKPSGGNSAANDDENGADVYDDYEYDEENEASRIAYRPVDDYPVSDDKHTYYDDDYRSH